MSDRYSWAELQADLGADIDAYLDFAAQYAPDRRTLVKRISALLTPSVSACVLYRLSHGTHRAGHPRVAFALAWINLLLTRVSIAPASCIGGGLYIPHPSTGIIFQGTAGRNLRLYAGSGACASFTPLHSGAVLEAPRLGDDVSIGAKAYVVGNVEVGAGARIGFNACVAADVPAGAIVVAAHVRNHVSRSRAS